MPTQCFAGVVELLVGRLFGLLASHLIDAVVTDDSTKGEQRAVRKCSANFTAAGIRRIIGRNGFGRDQERMTRGVDALPGSYEHLVGGLTRIGPAQGLSVPVGRFGQVVRLGERDFENRMQKIDDEITRRFVIAMNEYLDVAGFGGSIGHENTCAGCLI